MEPPNRLIQAHSHVCILEKLTVYIAIVTEGQNDEATGLRISKFLHPIPNGPVGHQPKPDIQNKGQENSQAHN